MSNFTKALKELTGFGDNEQGVESFLTQADKNPTGVTEEVITQMDTEAEAPKHVPIKAPTIPMVNIDVSEVATFISKTMMINGNIASEEDVVLEGCISGDITTARTFKSSGIQAGKVTANRLFFTGAKHKGNLEIKEIASIDKDAVVVGNINCHSLKFDGRIKGNTDVETESLFLDNAIVVGDVATGKINLTPGARISGNIMLRAAMGESEDEFNFDIDFDFGGEN